MRKHYWKLCFSALLALLLAAGSEKLNGLAATAEAAPSPAEVKIDNFTFEPSTLTVKAGTTITWTNRDDIPHTVVSADFLFRSKALDTDDKFTFKLEKPGTYSYFCSIHPKMTGKVIVE